MPEDLIRHPDGALLHAAAGACDTGYAWVSAAIASGAKDHTPEDLQELAAALKSPTRSSQVLRDFGATYQTDLARLASASVHVHEETHFHQLISTPYGRLMSELERYWVADLLGILQLGREELGEGAVDASWIPIRKWVEQNLTAELPARLVAGYAELVYTQTQGLRACLSGSCFVGFLGHKVSELSIGDALKAWTGFLLAQDRAEGAIDSPDLAIQQTSHPTLLMTNLQESLSSVPSIDGAAITPRAIQEGAALEIQLGWMRAALGDSPSLPSALRLLNSGLLDETYLRTRRIVTKALPRVPWPERRAVLLTLSDLALWGASHRDYLGGSDFELAWEDLHPGYRFVRALNVVAENHSFGGPDLRDSGAVTDLVCRELRWARPLEMARNYQRSFKPEQITSPMGEDALQEYRLRAVGARLAEPDAFIDGTNEVEVHQQFHLVMPFIVEQGGLRMQDLPESWSILIRAAVARLANGCFDARLSRLFNEPREISDMVHNVALEPLFGIGAPHIAKMLRDASQSASANLASNPATEEGLHLDELIERLRGQGLQGFAASVRDLAWFHQDRVVDWYVRQPTIVEAVLSQREMHADGSFSISWPSLHGIVRRAVGQSDGASLRELFEDCGYHYFNKDIEMMYSDADI